MSKNKPKHALQLESSALTADYLSSLATYLTESDINIDKAKIMTIAKEKIKKLSAWIENERIATNKFAKSWSDMEKIQYRKKVLLQKRNMLEEIRNNEHSSSFSKGNLIASLILTISIISGGVLLSLFFLINRF